MSSHLRLPQPSCTCTACVLAHTQLNRARVAGEAAAQLAGLGMVKCLAFSGSGRLLALGGDDGSLTVLDWPALRVRTDLRCALLVTCASMADSVLIFLGSQHCVTSVVHMSGA